MQSGLLSYLRTYPFLINKVMQLLVYSVWWININKNDYVLHETTKNQRNICYHYLLWKPCRVLHQNLSLKSHCTYYMRTKYPGFFSKPRRYVLIFSFMRNSYRSHFHNLIIACSLSMLIWFNFISNMPEADWKMPKSWENAFVDVFS